MLQKKESVTSLDLEYSYFSKDSLAVLTASLNLDKTPLSKSVSLIFLLRLKSSKCINVNLEAFHNLVIVLRPVETSSSL